MSNQNISKFLTYYYYSLGLIRSINYTTQTLVMPIIDRISSGQKNSTIVNLKKHLQVAYPKINNLLIKDAELIVSGIYPQDVIFEEAITKHYARIPKLFFDAYRAGQNRKNKISTDFKTTEADLLTEMPDYFLRNFHFQDGGYLTEKSAELYDHQVEVLFSGTAAAMRRQIIPSMKIHFNLSDGEGLKFLEIGSGTGNLTRTLALAFPKAHITSLDLSPHYLKMAQKRLSQFKRISFVQGRGEDLSFKDHSFDAVVSCYLFHELPEEIRHTVLNEKIRVLKSKGYLGLVDSLQLDDDPDLNWALEKFPQDFHEPYYKNYTIKKIENLFLKNNLLNISTNTAFLSKIVSGVKS